MREVAALFAPKPLLIISGTWDRIFPITATRLACRELTEVNALHGARGNLEQGFFDGRTPGTTALRRRSWSATGMRRKGRRCT